VQHTRIIVRHYGGPDELKVLEEECLEPRHGEVRVRVLAAGVSLPDIMMREGIHPETPRLPFTPGWELVGEVDRVGEGVSRIEPGQIVAALPITGAYAEFVCLPQSELVPVPSGLDAAEAVGLVLNYVTAYQMLHRSANVRAGQRVLIHGAAGGVGSALLQLGRLVGLEMYGTCSSRGAPAVCALGGIPIDYRELDFVKEIRRLTGSGVEVVFDGIGGTHIWRSRKALRRGGTVVAYGITASLRRGRLASGRPGHRHRFRGIAIFGLYIAAGRLLAGRKRVVPYSIQWLKRHKPALFRQDLIALFDFLRLKKIKPIIAYRFPLAQARHAQELLGNEGVTGKIVLVSNEPPLVPGLDNNNRQETGAAQDTRNFGPSRKLSPMEFTNTYEDDQYADAYAKLEFPGTYYLVFRDLPAIFAAHVTGRKALDFGCGSGRSTRLLRKLGFEAVGIDIAEPMVRRARAIDPEGDYRLVADGDLSAVAHSRFDLVLSAFAFDNIPGAAKKILLFRQLSRVLGPGGKIVNVVSAPEIYWHEWLSFSTKDFPENRQATCGDRVRIINVALEDKRPAIDILWPDEDYRQVYAHSGLKVVGMYKPLGRADEPYDWINEISVAPWVIYVLEKA
jgi:NADPH2:quinone reductase